MHPDQKYIDALIDNNRLVINEIYREYSGLVINFIVQNNGTIDDAKDVFQESLMVLFHKGTEGFVLRGTFKDYLFKICQYKWLDKVGDLKKIRDNEPEFRGFIADSRKEVEEELSVNEYKLFIESFEKLAPHCKEILTEAWGLGNKGNKKISLKDISKQLNCSYGYLRKEKCNCLKRLINIVKKQEAKGEPMPVKSTCTNIKT